MGSEAIRQRRGAIFATMLFFAVSCFVVIVYGLRIGGIDWARSISNHVGLAVYSSILFAVANTVVAVLIARHVNRLCETHCFSKVWLVLAAAIVLSLLIVSYFPFTGEGVWNSVIHRAATWTMFGMMVLFTMVTLLSIRTRFLMVAGGTFAVYGIVCLLLVVFFTTFFWNHILVIESSFILLAFLFILSIPVISKI